MQENKLLREYVRRILTEEMSGDYSASYMSGGSTFGGTAIKTAFVDPVTDIFKILKGRAKELFSGVKRLARVSLSGGLGLLTAGAWEPNYQAAKDAYNNEISKIRSEYEGARSAGIKALLASDLVAIGFLYNPAAVMTAKAALENIRKSNSVLLEREEDAGKNQKLPQVPAELVEKAHAAVDRYFGKIKNDLSKVKSAKNLQQLNAPKETIDKMSAELSEKPEAEKKQAEEKILEAGKHQIFMTSIKTLKQERDKIVGQMKEKGISTSDIMSKEGLPARYSEEIKKIAAMIGISAKE
jgi:hypothetical protein